MIKTLTALALLVSFSSFASETVSVKCSSDSETIRITANVENFQEPHYVEIFNQGGLGPDFLEASYVANSSELSMDDKSINLKTSFGGESLQVSLDKKTESGKGEILSANGKTSVDCKLVR